MANKELRENLQLRGGIKKMTDSSLPTGLKEVCFTAVCVLVGDCTSAVMGRVYSLIKGQFWCKQECTRGCMGAKKSQKRTVTCWRHCGVLRYAGAMVAHGHTGVKGSIGVQLESQ